MGPLTTVFPKVVYVQPNGPLLFAQLLSHNCFSNSHNPQQLFEKSQPNKHTLRIVCKSELLKSSMQFDDVDELPHLRVIKTMCRL
jgi:hypothetical protein